MVRLRTSRTGGFYYVKNRSEEKRLAFGDTRGEEGESPDCVLRRYHGIERGGKRVLFHFLWDYTIFFDDFYVRADGDIDGAVVWVCILYGRGFLGIFHRYGQREQLDAVAWDCNRVDGIFRRVDFQWIALEG